MADEQTKLMAKAPDGVKQGTQLNGIYEIDKLIAIGGMGEVYRGHNMQNQSPVAIKIILQELANDETVISLFQRESQTLHDLSHDAIVRYHLFARDPVIGRPYLAMEFVEGTPLSDHMRDMRMNVGDMAHLLIRLAEGLQAAHDADVVHRDLSPDNVILRDGKLHRSKIIDFGIAKSLAPEEGTILGGKFAGKYSFVSPEQLGRFDGVITPRSDIYSLALVAVAAMRGEALEMSGSPAAMLERRSSVPDLSEIDENIRPLFEWMLEPDPNDRPQSMLEVANWLYDLPEEILGPQEEGGATSWRRSSGAGRSETSAPRSQHPSRRKSVAPIANADPAGTPASEMVDPTVPTAETEPTAPESETAKTSTGKPAKAKNPTGHTLAATTVMEKGAVPADDKADPDAASASPLLDIEPAPVVSESPFGPAGPVTDLVPKEEHKEKSKIPVAIAAAVLLAALSGGGWWLTQGEEEPAPQVAIDETLTQPVTPPAAIDNVEPPTAETVERSSSAVDKSDPKAWVETYDSECVFASYDAASRDGPKLTAIGNASAQNLLTKFETTFATSPRTDIRSVSEAQCPIIAMAQAVRSAGTPSSLTLQLTRDKVESGATIVGAISGVDQSNLTVLIVDTKGLVYDLAAFVKQGRVLAKLETQPLFYRDPSGDYVPQLIVAIASDKSLASVLEASGKSAKEFVEAATPILSPSFDGVSMSVAQFQIKALK